MILDLRGLDRPGSLDRLCRLAIGLRRRRWLRLRRGYLWHLLRRGHLLRRLWQPPDLDERSDTRVPCLEATRRRRLAHERAIGKLSAVGRLGNRRLRSRV